MSSRVTRLEQTKFTENDSVNPFDDCPWSPTYETSLAGKLHLTGQSIVSSSRESITAVVSEMQEVREQSLPEMEVRRRMLGIGNNLKQRIGADIDKGTAEAIKSLLGAPRREQEAMMKLWEIIGSQIWGALTQAMVFVNKAIWVVLKGVGEVWAEVAQWLSQAKAVFSSIYR